MEIGNSFLLKNFLETIWVINPITLDKFTKVILKKVNDGSINQLQNLKPSKGSESSNIQIVESKAILNIEGTLVPKASWLDAMCGFTSTLKLMNDFKTLDSDLSISDIVLYIDSPGGASTAIPEFAQVIKNSSKKVTAYVDVQAASGGYWLAAPADEIVALPSATVGSIGVYTILIKEKEEDQSVDYYILQAGSKKLYGASFTKVSDEELEFFDERVNEIYQEFTESISKFRNIDINEVKATEGSFYSAGNAPSWMVDTLADSDYLNL